MVNFTITFFLHFLLFTLTISKREVTSEIKNKARNKQPGIYWRFNSQANILCGVYKEKHIITFAELCYSHLVYFL